MKWIEDKEIDLTTEWTNERMNQLKSKVEKVDEGTEKFEGQKRMKRMKINWLSFDLCIIIIVVVVVMVDDAVVTVIVFIVVAVKLSLLSYIARETLSRIVFHSSKWSVTKWFNSVPFDTRTHSHSHSHFQNVCTNSVQTKFNFTFAFAFPRSASFSLSEPVSNVSN